MSTIITNAFTTSALVITHNDVPMTTSLKVADVFGKMHKDVLKAIEALDCSEEFRKRNFALSSYNIVENRRPYPMYLMTRDGFTFLAMGFTGAKAAAFKELYIAEFNRMEAHIRNMPKFAVPQTMVEAMELALAQLKENEKLKAEQAVMAPKAEVYDAVVADKLMKLHIFARSLPKCNSMRIKRDLLDLGYLHRHWGTYKVYSQYRDKYFVEKVDAYTGKVDIYVTDEGKKLMTKLYNNYDLTRKVA